MSGVRNVLTPELCRTLVALIGAEGSVSGAARELGTDKANVSKQIRPLVHGCPPGLPRPWLIKQGRRFGLTDEGRLLFEQVREQVDRWAAFARLAAADRAPGLTVACGNEAAGGVVLAAAVKFRRAHPGAALRIAVVRGRQRLDGVLSGRYDLALVTDNAGAVQDAAWRPVTTQALAEDPLVLACGARAPWAADFADPRIPVDPSEVAGWPLVLPEADAAIRKKWDELWRRQPASSAPPVAIEVGGWRVLLGYALAGFGVGLVPRSVAESAGTKVRMRPLPVAIRPTNRVLVVGLQNAINPGLTATFRAALVEVAGTG